MLYVGIEIGGTKLQIVTGDRHGHIRQRLLFDVDKSKGASGIRTQIQQGIPHILGPTTKAAAVGVGFAGPVDWETGRISRSHQVEGWTDFPIVKWLSDYTGVPVVVDNDANAAAFGEANHGAGVGLNPVFHVTLSSGVGGGLVKNGEIYHGVKPGEAEIGHVRLDRSGTVLESRCSGWAVDTKVRDAIAKHPKSPLARSAAGLTGSHAKALKPALDDGDPVARQILEDTAADLAFGLSHVTHLIHPEIIILGGGLAQLGEPLRQAVETALHKWTMEAFAPGPKVVISKLGEDAVSIGALTLAKLRVY